MFGPRRVVPLLLALALLGAATPGRAQTQAKREAERLFHEARAAMATDDYVAARDLLLRSQRLFAGSGTLINLGYCYERLGFPALAYRTYRTAMSLAEATDHPERMDNAQQRLEVLVKKLGLVSLTLAQPGSTVTVDGQPVDAREPIAVEEGGHVLRVVAPNGATFQTTVQATRGTTSSVVVPNEPTPAPMGPRTAPAPPPTGDASTAGGGSLRGSQTTVGIATLAVGAAGLGVGAYFGFDAKRSWDATPRECDANVCTARGVALTHDALRAATLSTVSIAIGAAAMGVGTYLVVTAPKASSVARRIFVGAAGPRLVVGATL